MTESNLFLSNLGVIVPEHAISNYAFVVRSEKTTELIREFNLSGIFYNEGESITTLLRIYFYSETANLFSSLGYEVHMLEAEETEETEDEDEKGEGEKLSARLNRMYYIEYPIATSDLPTRRLPLQQNAVFNEIGGRSEKNKRTLENKIGYYFAAVRELNNRLEIQPESTEEEDVLTSAPRVSMASREAQFAAHREEQAMYREKAEEILDFFYEKVFAPYEGGEPTILSVKEAVEIYGDDLSITLADGTKSPIFSPVSLLEDFKSEVIRVTI